MNRMPEGSPSVLIIRLDGIGDAVALTPLLAALHRREIPVDVVLSPANARIFAASAARATFTAQFDQRSGARANLAAIAAFGRELRARKYSHVLVASEDPAAYRLAGAVDAPVRVGFVHIWGKPLKNLWTRRLLTKRVHRSAGLDRHAPHECEVLFLLGAGLVEDAAPTRDVRELRPMLLERAPASNGCVALQVTDKWERLGINSQGVVETIERAARRGTPQLLAARRESAYARAIAAATGLSITYFDALEPWKEAIAGAAALVTPDSGALHVAGMVGTPTVGIFPNARNYALQVARWAPWAAPHHIVRAEGDWPSRAGDALAQLLAVRR
jgi:ADP-heptose:LPS heptosyltransferase